MMRPMNIVTLAVGAALLAAMMLTTPEYNDAIKPFVTKVDAGQIGKTRLISGRFDAWRTADQISFLEGENDVTRNTEGVFLIVNLQLSGTTRSTPVDATWQGSSNRRYQASKRVLNLPQQIDLLWLQPGVASKTFAVFELPPDEIEGGRLLLTLGYNPPLDGTLSLAPPKTAPSHEPTARLGP